MPEIAAASAWVLAVVVAAAIVHRFVAFAVVVQSESMRPSLQPGDVILAGRARRRTRLRRGEILVYRDADAGDRRIRRLIALPGDHVEIGDDGAVTVDGDPLFEPYARRTGGFRGAFTVPGDRCFVLSDQRAGAHDARSWQGSFVPLADVVGVARVRLLPWPIAPTGVLAR